MNVPLSFEPFLPLPWLAAVFAISALPVLFSLVSLRRGSLLRLALLGLFLTAFLNPVTVHEQREPLAATVAIVVDRSQSQTFSHRTRDTDAALAALQEKLKAYPQFETRIVEAAKPDAADAAPSTRLFTALAQALGDVPPSRIAGAVFITDGQVHDIPQETNFPAPVNALISGERDEYDRRIRFAEAPRFGIVGKELALSMMVEDHGPMPPAVAGQTVRVQVVVNGEAATGYDVMPGIPFPFTITLPHAGKNIVELAAAPVEGEMTAANNRTAIVVDGIRENLKVLLISGEPHNGLRAWRDLLKSDTGVDLVHFTILRPPEKQDNTPINQLSLIVFPTTELFVDKIRDFDLVIFDRYQHYNVLPLLYYDYIAQYVKNGGALLMATGPEFAGAATLAATPLVSVLPVQPTGGVIEKPFLPQLTAPGRKHPVTRGLDGSDTTPPHWGRWLRQIPVKLTREATTLMTGDNGVPLLLLSHTGKGRVGMLLSDQGWLWARGYEGGGPYAGLYRRLAHWLMKEPELEEEALFVDTKGKQLTIRRQSMKDKVEPARIELPSGKTVDLPLTEDGAGLFTATIQSDENGLIRISHDGKTAVAHIGTLDAPEYGDIISTTERLDAVATSTGGHVLRLHEKPGDSIDIGTITASQNPQADKSSKRTLVLRETGDTRLVTTERTPLVSGLALLLAGLLLFAATWWREGKR